MAQIPSPADFLGYELGEQFTYHHRVVEYFKAVGAASPNVQLQSYGRSIEGRELMVAILSSPANLGQLEAIRTDNLKATGLAEGEKGKNQKPIVWLSYNIHGNEAVSSEAAMATLYTLVTNDTAGWLKEMIVIMDPCINPDGRERYTNWYRQAKNVSLNVNGDSWEHREPWPGGRFNHYLFDLNRDWCWQTQLESQLRAKLYQEWMPHVHVDFHEMGANSPYFFGPAAEPYHEVVTPWQREFQRLTGQNHARYFNQKGWLYFTKEIFDLFYPSYGDTWPTFQGAIGFTYEQGGSGAAGLALRIASGDTLRLNDRIAHHYTTGLSTIESAYNNQLRLLKEFNAYFEKAQNNPDGKYKSYVLRAKNQDKLYAMLDLLEKNQIQYSINQNSEKAYNGYDYSTEKDTRFSLAKGDLVISAYQPQANLVKVLFEPEALLVDSMTYDVTAWSLPYAYDIHTFATVEKIDLESKKLEREFNSISIPETLPYAYVLPWQDLQDARFLGALLQAKIRVRYATESFSVEGKTFDRGSLIISRGDNPKKDFDAKVITYANQYQRKLTASGTGFVDAGKDFGSNKVKFIKPAKIALVSGKGTYPSSFGELWHFFEQDLHYPVTVLNTEYLAGVDLSKYDVVILGQGSYSKFRDKLLTYAKTGGKLIALEAAINTFTGKNKESKPYTTLGKVYISKQKEDEKAKLEAIKTQSAEEYFKRYEHRERDRLSNYVSGSIYKVKLDNSHPIAYGQDSIVYFIKRNRTAYPYLPVGSWNVGAFIEDEAVSGFTGAKLEAKLENTLAIGVESQGQGQLIYFADSPVFRQFWYGGKLLLCNAVFF
ncbi:MAG: M14 metallopeptidase family protein [Bacteroidota bacterium]